MLPSRITPPRVGGSTGHAIARYPGEMKANNLAFYWGEGQSHEPVLGYEAGVQVVILGNFLSVAFNPNCARIMGQIVAKIEMIAVQHDRTEPDRLRKGELQDIFHPGLAYPYTRTRPHLLEDASPSGYYYAAKAGIVGFPSSVSSSTFAIRAKLRTPLARVMVRGNRLPRLVRVIRNGHPPLGLLYSGRAQERDR